MLLMYFICVYLVMGCIMMGFTVSAYFVVSKMNGVKITKWRFDIIKTILWIAIWPLKMMQTVDCVESYYDKTRIS